MTPYEEKMAILASIAQLAGYIDHLVQAFNLTDEPGFEILSGDVWELHDYIATAGRYGSLKS